MIGLSMEAMKSMRNLSDLETYLSTRETPAVYLSNRRVLIGTIGEDDGLILA